MTEAARAEPGVFRPARFMYGLALLLGDDARAKEALHAYHWGGKPLPLYPEAGLAGKPAATVRYANFCYRVRNAVDEFYRRRCSRRPLGLLTPDEDTKLCAIVLNIATETWPDVQSAEQLRLRVEEFNGFLQFEPWGLAFGHRVIDSSQEIEQYGRKTRGAFILLDDLISNGSVSRYSDGASVIGGWAGPPMVQTRTESAIRYWLGISDAKRRPESDRRMAEATAADDEIARRNPHAYLEGLAMRIRRRAQTDVLNSLEGLEGNALRLAFLGEVQRRQMACVQAHEARHQIEGSTTRGMVRERNAALSQVIFGGHPADCMAGILVPNPGLKDNGSAEGAGNIMERIVRWMDLHVSSIAGFDKSRPTLPQFDKLTDAQMVEAFRSMDPWAERE